MNDSFQYSGLFHCFKVGSALPVLSLGFQHTMVSWELQKPCFLISPTENLPWKTPSLSNLQMISQKAHPSFYSTIVPQNSQLVYINKKPLVPPPSSSINCKFSLNFCLNSTQHLFGLAHRIQYLIHLIQINIFYPPRQIVYSFPILGLL